MRLRLRSDHGQALVEFAFVLPILVLLVSVITQFGLAFRNNLAITDAARVGARAAAVKRTDNPCGAAQSAILNTLSETQKTGVVFPSDWCDAAGKNVGSSFTIKIEYPNTIRGLPGITDAANLELTVKASSTERME